MFDKQVMGKLETLANSLGIPHERVEKLRVCWVSHLQVE